MGPGILLLTDTPISTCIWVTHWWIIYNPLLSCCCCRAVWLIAPHFHYLNNMEYLWGLVSMSKTQISMKHVQVHGYNNMDEWNLYIYFLPNSKCIFNVKFISPVVMLISVISVWLLRGTGRSSSDNSIFSWSAFTVSISIWNVYLYSVAGPVTDHNGKCNCVFVKKEILVR